MKVKEKILDNYEKEIRKEIEQMKKKGFIVTSIKEIFQYDPLTDRFIKVPEEDFYNILDYKVNSYWNFKRELLKEIAEKYIFNSAEENVLPIIHENSLNHYYNYVEAKNYLADESNVIGKRTVNKLLKENDSKKDSSVILNLNDVRTQAQVLINNNIFIDLNGRLYKYNENINSFEIITSSDLHILLYDNLPEEEIAKSKLIKQTIINAVDEGVSYGEYRTLLTYANNIPSLVIEQEAKEEDLTLFKDSFKAIEKIVKTYE